MAESEYIVELNLGYTPEAAVSGAVTVQTEYSTFLTFNAMKLEADGSYQDAGIALVEFPRCSIAKFGYPNDEAWFSIPRTSGLSYGIHEVFNSTWIAEIDALNRHAFPHFERQRGRHFLFLFHDSSFECIAHDIKLKIFNQPYSGSLRADHPACPGRVIRWRTDRPDAA